MTLHALLIGIDHYLANDYCSDLFGAVNDVEAMAGFLERLEVSPDRIRKLASPDPGSGRSRAPEQLPTYENMVRAIQGLTAAADPGDQVLIHYSGHGGRTPTMIPGAKGEAGLDEGLVPFDVADPQAPYLRDVELGYLVHQMHRKDLLVTLILDACHSGSMIRGPSKTRAKRTRYVDKTERPRDSLVASPAELEKTWRELYNRAYVTTPPVTRSVRKNWLPGHDRLVLVAASRPTETAYETWIDHKPRGVLTSCLLATLAAEGPDLSLQQIYNRLLTRVRRCEVSQTPVIEGDVSRSLIGGARRRLLDRINVLEVDPKMERVRLNAGQALGLHAGALLRIYPDAAPRRRPRAEVEITLAEAFNCWADARDGSSVADVEIGDQAILIDPGKRFRRRIALVPPENGRETTPPRRQDRTLRDGSLREAPATGALRDGSSPPLAVLDPAQALDAVRQEIEARQSGFLELTGNDAPPDFQIAVQRQAHEIRNRDGHPLSDLPPLPLAGRDAARRAVDCAVHLAQFHNVRDLGNDDATSPLHAALTVELGLLPEDFAGGDKLVPMPFESPGSLPEVEIGRRVCLTVTNHSEQALEIYVLDLQPGWSIEQIHPRSGLETLEGGQQVNIAIEIYLPGKFQCRREIFKVIGTNEPADFRWLQLPPAGRRRRKLRSPTAGRSDPLERLFAEIAVDGPRMRSVRTHHASRHWTTAQVEFEVVGD